MAKALKVKKVSPDDECTAAAVHILRTRLKEFYSHWRDPDQTPTPAQLHDLRISGKRLRYSADSLRTIYSDRLTLLIDLLKRLQDLLGEMQDCETQRAVIEADIVRRKPSKNETAALQQIIQNYHERQAKLLTEITELWRGISSKKFRASLKDLISHPSSPAHDSEDSPTHG